MTRRAIPAERFLSDGAIERLRVGVGEPALQLGTTFANRYLLQARVAKGGMGVLFRAFDTQLRRRVALKVLHRDREWNGSSKGRARVLREARAAAALTHWNVVTIHDVGEHDGVAFIAMEYVEGRPLSEFVRERYAAFELRLRWMTDVARVLEAAHARGLVHRDIKPDNVMITDDGEVKVLDFGIASYREPVSQIRANPRSWHDDDLDETSAWIVGTPGYMPPEQMRGDDLDARGDQFAWAVTAYELFSGALPWKKPVRPDDVRYGDPKPFGTEIPSHVARVIERAMKSRRSERFPSMRDVVSALQCPAPASGQRRRAGSRGRVPRGAFLALAALVIAVFAVAGIMVRGFASSSATTGSKITTRPMVRTELPPCAAAARVSYGQGIAALREANGDFAHTAFEKAAEADPSCPEAQLRLLMTGETHYSIVKEREQLARAQRLRDALSERDRVLLDAWTPLVIAEPPDRDAAARLLEAGAARFPRDAELLMFAASARSFYAKDRASVERGLELAQRATTLDPQSASAWQVLAGALWRLQRLDEARLALDRCLELSPTSADCMHDHGSLLSNLGDCEQSAAEARRSIERVPNQRRGYRQLSHALAAAGAPESIVQEALERRWELVPDSSRQSVRLDDMARLAVLYGHFERAEQLVIELTKEIELDPTLAAHQRAAATRVELLMETDRAGEAAAIAERFLLRKDVWAGVDVHARAENQDHGLPYEPMMFAVLLRQHEIDGPKWRAATETWETRAQKIVRPRDAWSYRFSPVADISGYAAQAWRDRPVEREPSLPGGWFISSPNGMYEGHVALRAGRAAEAVISIEPAARACRSLSSPFLYTRAQLWLGEAKERTGDIAGACEAYDRVLRRWGDAKPRSITAREARARSAALGCVSLAHRASTGSP